MKRAALYARFSSDHQREESITAQLRASHEYCKAKGYTVVREYADEAQSGTTIVGREGFQQMILDSGDDIFDVVVIHKIDRAARNSIDYYANMSRLEKNGVSYEYSAEGIDTTTANGKLTEGIKVAIASWYSLNLADEVKKGKKETALQCKHNGGSAPFGYDVDKDGHYIVNQEEAPYVRKIFEMKADGKGYGEIIDYLNAHGVKTKKGGSFAKNSMHDILRNKKYIGVFQYGRAMRHNNHKDSPDVIEIENGLPAIVDRDLYDKVQTIMNASKNGRNSAKTPYFLSGKIYCACGASMTGQTMHNKQGTIYRYYVCRNRYYKRLECSTPRVKKDAIEKFIFNVIMANLKYHSEDIINEFMKLNEDNTALETKKTLAGKITKQEKKIERLLNLYAETGDDAVKQSYQSARDELLLMKKEYASIKEDRSVSLDEVKQFIEEMSRASFTESEIKKIFDLFVERVTVHEETFDLKLTISCNTFVVEMRRTYPLCNELATKKRCSPH